MSEIFFSRIIDDQANCCVTMQSGEVVIIENSLVDSGQQYLIGRYYVNPGNSFAISQLSSTYGIYRVETLSETSHFWPIRSIANKNYRITIPATNCGAFGIIPLITEMFKDY